MPSPEPNPYAIEGVTEAPELPGSQPVVGDIECVLDALCSELLVRSSGTISEAGSFHMGLVLNPATERLIMKLMVDPKYRSMPWGRTEIWSLDDPCVEPEHADHSLGTLTELLLDAAGMDRSQVHVIEGHRADCCEAASEAMRATLTARGEGFDRLDSVVLPCVPDWIGGHEDPVGRLYTHREGPGTPRVSLTTRVLNGAAFLAVLGDRESHWSFAHEVGAGRAHCALSPISGHLRWYLHNGTEES